MQRKRSRHLPQAAEGQPDPLLDGSLARSPSSGEAVSGSAPAAPDNTHPATPTGKGGPSSKLHRAFLLSLRRHEMLDGGSRQAVVDVCREHLRRRQHYLKSQAECRDSGECHPQESCPASS